MGEPGSPGGGHLIAQSSLLSQIANRLCLTSSSPRATPPAALHINIRKMEKSAEESPLLGGASQASLSNDTQELQKLDNLASAQYRAGKYAESESLLRKAYEKRRALLGEQHQDTLLNLNNLAAALGRLGRFKDAEETFRTTLEGRTRLKGPNHADTLTTLNHLGVLMKQQGDLAAAETRLAQALDGFTATLGADHLCTAEAAYNFAVLCTQQGRRRKAAGLFSLAHGGLKKALGAEHQHTLDALTWEIKCKESESRGEIPSQTSPAHNPASTSPSCDVEAAAPEAIFQTKLLWKKAIACEVCTVAFTMVRREHHCRICCRSVCHDCAQGKTTVLEFSASVPQRICAICEQQGF